MPYRAQDVAHLHHLGLHHSAQEPDPRTDYEMVSHLMHVFVEARLFRAVRGHVGQEWSSDLEKQARFLVFIAVRNPAKLY